MGNSGKSPFDAEYVSASSTDADQKNTNKATKSFLKAPIKKEDLELYGAAKPRRIIIRADMKHGQD